jgi:glycosyltransferase involved in cell wall biosynthesis
VPEVFGTTSRWPRKVLLVHDRPRWRGGVDVAVDTDAELLDAHGHRVVWYERHSAEIDGLGLAQRVRLAGSAIWAGDTRRDLSRLLARERPDVVHLHETFPLISASAYGACRDAEIPVVQTLHNFRPVCPNALLFRDGRPCRDCVGRTTAWPGILHACYRNSRSQSAVVAATLVAHRALRVWQNGVDVFITPSVFVRDLMAAGGLPAERMTVRPNPVAPDPGMRRAGPRGDFVLFVGRLSPEKGLDVLIDGVSRLSGLVPLVIVGEGPERASAEHRVARRGVGSVSFAGALPRNEVLGLMRQARLLVFPSACYENAPLVLIEAMASGLPVVASDAGAAAEQLDQGRSGMLFRSGDPDDLAAQVWRLWEHPEEADALGRAGRRTYEARHAPGRGYQGLIDAYRLASDVSRRRRTCGVV